MLNIDLLLLLSRLAINLIFFALSLNAGNLVGDLFLNASLLGLVDVPANVLCFILMNVQLLGRKRTIGLANIIGGLASLICVPVILFDGKLCKPLKIVLSPKAEI